MFCGLEIHIAYLSVGVELLGERVVDDGLTLEENLEYCQ